MQILTPTRCDVMSCVSVNPGCPEGYLGLDVREDVEELHVLVGTLVRHLLSPAVIVLPSALIEWCITQFFSHLLVFERR